MNRFTIYVLYQMLLSYSDQEEWGGQGT